ncbi:MAG: Asp-tRNA(Asn)/Glu-tRNA(Gln) amidotransferase subunit GatC [Leptospirillia bacterium]
MNLEKKDVLNVARLAGLALTNEEAERMTGELSSILDYVEALGTVAVADELTGSIEGGGRPLARDLAAPFPRVGEALALAPDAGGGFFRVPRILEEGR